MKTTKIISVCKTDCDSTTYKVAVDAKGEVILDKDGRTKEVVRFHKATKKGASMYVVIETLPNGKKKSTTHHGFPPALS